MSTVEFSFPIMDADRNYICACEACGALVSEDYRGVHQQWHATLAEPLRRLAHLARLVGPELAALGVDTLERSTS